MGKEKIFIANNSPFFLPNNQNYEPTVPLLRRSLPRRAKTILLPNYSITAAAALAPPPAGH